MKTTFILTFLAALLLGSAAFAKEPCKCWIDVKTGKRAPSVPLSTVPTYIPHQGDYAVILNQGGRTAFNPVTKQNYALEPGGCWIDVETGKQAPSVPLSTVPTYIPHQGDYAVILNQGGRTAFNPITKQNYALVPCPEPTEQVSPQLTTPTVEHAMTPSEINWSGFYAGIEGNYTRSSADFSLMPTGDFNQFPDLSDELRFRGRHEFDGDGGGIGGYGGYNFMLCEHFLFGLEVEGRRVWGLRDHFRTGDFDFGRLGMFDIHSSFDTEDIPYLVTFGPRLGYALGKFLPYLRGGLAFGQVDVHQGIRTSALGGNTFGKESTTQLGWCVGGGLEYALTDHWRLRVEYQYTDLGTLDFMGRGNPDSFRHFTSWNSADVTEHSGNFGLGYSFSQFGKK